MKNTIESDNSGISRQSSVKKISRALQIAVAALGIGNALPVNAAPISKTDTEKLESAQHMNQGLFHEKQQLENNIQEMWDNLGSIPGRPQNLFDRDNHLTKEAEVWLKKGLPANYQELISELHDAQEALKSAKKGTPEWLYYTLIVLGIISTILLSVTLFYGLKITKTARTGWKWAGRAYDWYKKWKDSRATSGKTTPTGGSGPRQTTPPPGPRTTHHTHGPRKSPEEILHEKWSKLINENKTRINGNMTQEEARKLFRRMSVKTHPDKFPEKKHEAEVLFKILNDMQPNNLSGGRGRKDYDIAGLQRFEATLKSEGWIV